MSECDLAQFDTPLKPDTDYFDATAAIEAIAETLRDQNVCISELSDALQRQLLINGQLIGAVRQLMARVDKLEGVTVAPTRLIMPGSLN